LPDALSPPAELAEVLDVGFGFVVARPAKVA
jgi:hypothetical protein